jgi:hypothetical protein
MMYNHYAVAKITLVLGQQHFTGLQQRDKLEVGVGIEGWLVFGR